MPPLSALFLLLLLGPTSLVSGAEWGYKLDDSHGPPHWSGECQSGKRQSPIDIVVRHTTPVRFDGFHFRHFNHLLSGNNNVTVLNNGHTIVLGLGKMSPKSVPAIKEGGLEATYVLDHIHFHAGAEHLINGKRYPLEAHLVHREQHSETISQALTKRDGIAVLGVLFHVSKTPNKSLRPLWEALRKLEGADEGQKVSLKSSSSPMALSALLPHDVGRFFRYYGSLTTPGCHEAVIWTVFEMTIPISEEELKLFNRMPEDNYRPAQNLNQRFVLRNEPSPYWESNCINSSASAPSTSFSLLFLPSVLVYLMLQRRNGALH
ncbi:putative carbonic anhydrase 3 [Ischnura elegans]|uniref:putative carbonic anhydrase 3 n=1 Tax=Ischnura elegans TaxID=197161 RepID=UPI001ED89270|nr:putative carbonic anhydrase 3 [Ischnura elegans]